MCFANLLVLAVLSAALMKKYGRDLSVCATFLLAFIYRTARMSELIGKELEIHMYVTTTII